MRERPRSVFQMKVERVFAGLPEEADEHEKKYVPLFKCKSGTKWNKPLLLCTALLLLSAFWRARIFFFGRFPLVYELKQASDPRKRERRYCVNRVNAV